MENITRLRLEYGEARVHTRVLVEWKYQMKLNKPSNNLESNFHRINKTIHIRKANKLWIPLDVYFVSIPLALLVMSCPRKKS